MYKKLVQSRCDNELYEVLKARFNTYRNIVKKAISKAKRMYSKIILNKPGKLLKKHCIKTNLLKYLKDCVILVKS